MSRNLVINELNGILREFNNGNGIAHSIQTVIQGIVNAHRTLDKSELEKKSKYTKMVKKILNDFLKIDKMISKELDIQDRGSALAGYREEIDSLIFEIKQLKEEIENDKPKLARYIRKF